MSSPTPLQSAIQQVNTMVTGVAAGAGQPSTNVPMNAGVGMATQSVAQSMAIAVQDAADLMRNISTIEATAIGVATAKWIEQPENVLYMAIIEECQKVITDTAATLLLVGTNASKVLQGFASPSSGAEGKGP